MSQSLMDSLEHPERKWLSGIRCTEGQKLVYKRPSIIIPWVLRMEQIEFEKWLVSQSNTLFFFEGASKGSRREAGARGDCFQPYRTNRTEIRLEIG